MYFILRVYQVQSLRLLIDGMILVTSRIIEDNETKKAAIPGVKNVERFESYRTKVNNMGRFNP